jgi:hypothetical protein
MNVMRFTLVFLNRCAVPGVSVASFSEISPGQQYVVYFCSFLDIESVIVMISQVMG